MEKLIPINVTSDGCARTILAGYYKYGKATLLGEGGYGTTGTCILVVNDDSDEKDCISDKNEQPKGI